MKRLFIFFIALLLCAGSSWGITVQVGSGTATTVYLPIRAYYGYTYSQQIYTQAQIATTGSITSLRFYLNSGGPVTNSSDWVIYLGHTTKTSFTSTTDWIPVSALTQVFAGTVTFPADGNWMEIILATPFSYNNVDNLVVAVDENTSSYSDIDVLWSSFTSGTNTGIYYYSDPTNPNPASPPAGVLTSNINQIQFEITTDACTGTPAPGNTVSSANPACPGVNFTLSLQNPTPGTGVTYLWESSPDNSTWSPTGGTSSSYVTSQATATWYRCQVTCAGNTGISNQLQVTMSTTALPVIESFDGTTFPPGCWQANAMTRETTGTSPTCATHSGAGMVRFNSFSISTGGTGTLITPALDLPSSNFRLKFWMYRDNGYPTNPDLVNVYLNSSPTITGATRLGTINRAIGLEPVVSANGWYEYVFPFGPGSAGNGKYVILEGVSAFGNNIFLDDVTVEEFFTGTLEGVVTNCISGLPLEGAFVSSGLYSGATNASGFYQITGMPVGTYTLTTSLTGYYNTTTTNVAITANQTTTQNICLTYITCYEPSGLSVVPPLGTTSVNLQWTPGSSPSTNWIVEYGPKGFAHVGGTSVPVSTTPSTTLTGLTPGAEYDVYVRTDCGLTDGLSIWAGPVSFRTHYFDCPSGSTAEAEPCGSDLNGGCNMTTPAFEPLALNQTICGTGWCDGTTRDTDWFTFTLTETMDVTLTGSADFELLIGFIASPCPATAFIVSATGAAGTTVTVLKNLAAGTYYAFAAPSLFTTIIQCGGADRYKITLTGTNCFAPTALTATTITTTSAQLGWTSTGTQWNVQHMLENVPLGSGTIVPATNPFNLTNLLPSTAYKFYVQTDCGSGNLSPWAGPYSFTTLCVPVMTPFGPENFAGSTFPPACWTRFQGILAAPSTLTATTYNWIQDDWRNVLSPVNKAARLNIWTTTTKDWLMTPQIDLGATSGNFNLDFDLALNAYSTSTAPGPSPDDKFVVVISTDGGTTWTSVNTLREWNNTGSSYVYDNINWSTGEHVTIPVNGYSGVIMIGFYGESTLSNGDNDLMIDNVTLTSAAPVVPTNYTASGTVNDGLNHCYNATNTVTVTNYTASGAGTHAEFVAGVNILFQQPVLISSQATMWAHITSPTGPFCGPTDAPMVAATGTEDPTIVLNTTSFSLFPNPTTGNFTLVQRGDRTFGSVKVEVYGISGTKVMTEEMIGLKQQEFRFAGMPNGLYFVRIVADDYVETIKLVKTR